jgi:hypothetical protein
MAVITLPRSPRRAQLHSRKRRRLMKPVERLPVYETLFALNRDFEQVLAHFERLQELGVLHPRELGNVFPAIIQETRAWANMELVEALRPLEQDDLTHFNRLHIDVLNEAGRWQKKRRKAAGKKSRRKRGGAGSEAYERAGARPKSGESPAGRRAGSMDLPRGLPVPCCPGSAAARSRGRIRKSPQVTAREMDTSRTVGARIRTAPRSRMDAGGICAPFGFAPCGRWSYRAGRAEHHDADCCGHAGRRDCRSD